MQSKSDRGNQPEIVGWAAHQKVAELQQNPWAIVELIGGNR